MKKKNSFVSNFEHINFAINKKIFQKNYDNSNYYASFVIFQSYKNAVLKVSTHLGGSFDYVFTHIWKKHSLGFKALL